MLRMSLTDVQQRAQVAGSPRPDRRAAGRSRTAAPLGVRSMYFPVITTQFLNLQLSETLCRQRPRRRCLLVRAPDRNADGSELTTLARDAPHYVGSGLRVLHADQAEQWRRSQIREQEARPQPAKNITTRWRRPQENRSSDTSTTRPSPMPAPPAHSSSAMTGFS